MRWILWLFYTSPLRGKNEHPNTDILLGRLLCWNITDHCVASDATAVDALEQGLNDLIDLCDVMTEDFTNELRRTGRIVDEDNMEE